MKKPSKHCLEMVLDTESLGEPTDEKVILSFRKLTAGNVPTYACFLIDIFNYTFTASLDDYIIYTFRVFEC